MTHPPAAPMPRPSVELLVCESGHRWCDTARRFVGPFQHAFLSAPPGGVPGVVPHTGPSEPVIAVRAVEHSKVRASIAGLPRAVILWEVGGDNAVPVALTLAQIGVGRPDLMQLIAIDAPSRRIGRRLALSMMELGARAVVQTPEDFADIAPLIRRYFQASTEVRQTVRAIAAT
ncbi:hypothetical protein FYK55_18715 [Roseiconus nitratireducens]|uniref:Uncharacterized protein n=1 Tax=Roseiconus nitratireducens TaxID=2605748 RepID=A0A5M6D1Q7_9BACT|nr:hypothetical protein [Roseiconus nitratireducens]KAA5540946.1 hypothetical protein FYK55_18715 [Roseiconus nitratireducens]